jgi:hypothetical protein
VALQQRQSRHPCAGPNRRRPRRHLPVTRGLFRPPRARVAPRRRRGRGRHGENTGPPTHWRRPDTPARVDAGRHGRCSPPHEMSSAAAGNVCPQELTIVPRAGRRTTACLGPVRRVKSEGSGGASSARVSWGWCMQLQGGGGRRRDGGPPAPAREAAGGSGFFRTVGLVSLARSAGFPPCRRRRSATFLGVGECGP